MIRSRIKELMNERGIKPSRIHALVQLGISYKIARTYLNGSRKKINYDHMEILCFFFHCAPHDLVEWVPDNKIPFDEQHPIQQIKTRKPFNLMDAIKNLSLEEIRKKLER